MDLDDSGIDSDPKVDSSSDYQSPGKTEPIISFSPDRSRFHRHGSTPPSSASGETILSLADQPSRRGGHGDESNCTDLSISNNCMKSTGSDLQKRLEKRIARANSGSGSQWSVAIPGCDNVICEPGKHSRSSDQPQAPIPAQSSTLTSVNGKAPIPNSTTGASGTGADSRGLTATSGFDARKVPSLLPPQRLAIPHKSVLTNSFNSNEGSSSENKPLVQWDSDDSEEELSFFPTPKSRGILNDNLSIDNMSLSGEEDDLHLSPPRPIAQRCPCDPRLLFDSSSASSSATSSTSHKNCTIV